MESNIDLFHIGLRRLIQILDLQWGWWGIALKKKKYELI